MSLHYLVKFKLLLLKISSIYFILTVASKFARFESSWLQSVGNIAKKGVQNIHNWSRRTETANGERQVASYRHCVSVSSVASSTDPEQWCVFCTHSLAILLNAVINWIQRWRIWRPQLRQDELWSYFLWQLSDSTCLMSILSFTR